MSHDQTWWFCQCMACSHSCLSGHSSYQAAHFFALPLPSLPSFCNRATLHCHAGNMANASTIHQQSAMEPCDRRCTQTIISQAAALQCKCTVQRPQRVVRHSLRADAGMWQHPAHSLPCGLAPATGVGTYRSRRLRRRPHSPGQQLPRLSHGHGRHLPQVVRHLGRGERPPAHQRAALPGENGAEHLRSAAARSGACIMALELPNACHLRDAKVAQRSQN